ncbi:MAG: RNA polymerase sigma-70 factor [Maribacter sp.]
MKYDQKLSDKELVCNLNKSCEISFRSLYNRYIEPVTNYAFSICRNREMAEDIAQDTFVKVWEKRATLDSEKSIKFFLFVLVKNMIISDFRKLNTFSKYKSHFKHLNENNEPSLETEIDGNELTRILQKAIGSLPEKRKQVYLMSRNEHLSHQEISSRLNISVRTVEVHIALALKNIRKFVNFQYLGPAAVAFFAQLLF